MIEQADLQGHWRRDWLKAGGRTDAETRVHWLQAGGRYADLRIPADRPARVGRALADQPPDTLRSLMRAEAFAGTTEVAGGICTWHRALNWHGRPDGVDAGRLRFEDGALIEAGVEGDYSERWLHRGAGLSARTVTVAGFEGVLVQDDARFLLVTGRPGAPASRALLEALDGGRVPDGLAGHFAPPCMFGEWRGEAGLVTLSTNPFHEGRVMLERRRDELAIRMTDFHGRTEAVRVVRRRGCG